MRIQALGFNVMQLTQLVDSSLLMGAPDRFS